MGVLLPLRWMEVFCHENTWCFLIVDGFILLKISREV